MNPVPDSRFTPYQRQRHECDSGVLNLPGDATDLFFVQEEFARPTRLVVGPGSEVVFGNVHSLQPQLGPIEKAVPVRDGGSARPQTLHLGSRQLDSRLIYVIDRVVVSSFPVLGYDLPPCFARHVTRPRSGHTRCQHEPLK